MTAFKISNGKLDDMMGIVGYDCIHLLLFSYSVLYVVTQIVIVIATTAVSMTMFFQTIPLLHCFLMILMYFMRLRKHGKHKSIMSN